MYAEVILPLPLYGTYTYAVPDDMIQQIRVGARVLVPFGKKKTYTGLVESTHNNAPAGYDIKSILILLDEAPIINYPQLNHWKWIADYYLCSIGDVFKAALPTCLKPESETFVTLNDDFEAPEGFKMTERQAEIIGILQQSGRKRISELENATGHKNITAVISRMLDASIINIDEKIIQK